MLASNEIDKPLTFLPNGFAVFVLKETFENSGESTAIDVGSWADLIPLNPNVVDGGPALLRQSQYCDKWRAPEQDPRSHFIGFIIFPKREHTIMMAMAVSPTDLAKAKAANLCR